MPLTVFGRVWAVGGSIAPDSLVAIGRFTRLRGIAIVESMAVRFERERLIELLQRDALKRGTFTLGERPHFALLRRRPQAHPFGRGCRA